MTYLKPLSLFLMVLVLYLPESQC